MITKILVSIFLMALALSSYANWTEYKQVGQLQTYGGGLQVWLENINCPNAKPYFSVSETYTEKVETVISLVLMAKASKSNIQFQYNSSDDPNYCYVTGIRVQ